MNKAPRLAETELAVLSAADRRRSRAVLPFPKGVDTAASKTRNMIQRLVAANMIAERPSKTSAGAWRHDEAGQNFILQITDVGKEAVSASVNTNGSFVTSSVSKASAAAVADAVPAPRGKIALVLETVCREQGASLDELIALTGWLPHTIRACLTRLRQGGVTIRMANTDNGRRYVSGTGPEPVAQ